jgi:hypothetical protein
VTQGDDSDIAPEVRGLLSHAYQLTGYLSAGTLQDRVEGESLARTADRLAERLGLPTLLPQPTVEQARATGWARWGGQMRRIAGL